MSRRTPNEQLAEAQAAWARIQEQGYRAVIRGIANQIWHRTRRPPEESWFGCRTPESGLWTWEEVETSVELTVGKTRFHGDTELCALLESATIEKKFKQIGLMWRPVPMAMCCKPMLAE